MKQMKRLLAALLVLCMAVSLAACTSKTETDPSANKSDPSAQKSDTPANSGEPLVINWVAYNHSSGVLPSPDNEVLKLLEEKYNIKINLEKVNIHDEEQRGLYWASGAQPDYITFNTAGAKEIPELIAQDFLRPIPDGYYETYMPDYIKLLTDSLGEDCMEECRYDDGYYVIPYAYSMMPYIMAVRKDWMDKLGITKLPTNEDELLELLKAFTFNDPDGNGIDDTYGIHGYYKGYGMGYTLASLGTAYNSYWRQDDGSVIYTGITEEYREGLRIFRSWYEAGVIDPEFTTDDRATERNKWSTGKFGVLVDDTGWWLDGQANNLIQILQAADPKAEVVFIEPFTNADGVKSDSYRPVAVNADGCGAFGANCSDEKMKVIMQFKNDLATDPEFYDRVYYGIEGEDYTREESGLIKVNPDSVTPEAMAEKGINVIFGLVPDCDMVIGKKYSPRDQDLLAFALDVDRVVLVNTNFICNKTNQAKNDYGGDIDTIAAEYWFNAISGVKNLDSDWDAYVQSLKAAGLQKICDEYAEILK